MLDFALAYDGPCSLRYPKAGVDAIERDVAPLEAGRAEIVREGRDGTIVCCGTLLCECLKAADLLAEQDLDVGVINARFVKPLDRETILAAVADSPLVVTVEEGALMGGFGSAVLEAASEAQLSTAHVRRLGIPDRFIEHAERHELLTDLGLDAAGIADACRRDARRGYLPASHRPTAKSPLVAN
jgi:1-deoxy-D-xylulose-5-phosphate synthase